ncbi:MAG: DsbA family protein [bacterium]|nr:DsbA family protein [bacterium]
MEQENKQEIKSTMTVPVAIIIAGAIIAGAIFYTSGKSGTIPKPVAEDGKKEEVVKIPPVTAKDHILGNPDAPVVLVEYSDTECPYCKTFHPTVKQIMDQYGKDGKVALVYRHFPLDSIHPKARKEAEGAECANNLGGNDKFWAYMDRIFEITPSNNQLDPAKILEIAKYIGLDGAKFETCLNSGKYAAHIEEDFQGGLKAGVTGTPSTFAIIKKTGEQVVIPGAQPLASVKSFIDSALAK